MRKIYLKRKKFSNHKKLFCLVDDSTFTWASKYKWHLNGGYAHTVIDNCTIALHHCIVGKPLRESYVIDHINSNKLDNQIHNLEIVSHGENVKRGAFLKYL